jgi:Ca2+-binding EF-hand superfamily protein
MLTRRNLITAVVVTGANWAVAGAAAQEKDTVPTRPDKLLLGQDEVAQLLLLMDTNKNGRISKDEWMKFMSDEFDRLDTDKSGQLDVKELERSRLRATRHTNTGK